MTRASVATLLLGLLPVSLAAAAPAKNAQDPVAAARAWREAHGAEILADFAELLAMPNVARDLEGVQRNAEHLRAELGRRGIEARLLERQGVPPLVYGKLEIPGAQRTLGIYVHYDGQPVEGGTWTYPPWQATLLTRSIEDGGQPRPLPKQGEAIDPEWRIYARSAGDDKAPFPAIFAALDALRASEIGVTSNLIFLFEGEEEAGSPHLGDYFAEHRALLDPVGLWLIVDGPLHQSRRPQLVFGVRGVVDFQIEVYGASRELHSGHYGNWAPNPGMALAQLVASMKDADGNVVIEGFYDSTTPVGSAERAALAALPSYDEELRHELALARSEGQDQGQTLPERLLRPSLNLRGIASGSVGTASRNAIPTSAVASFDIRLVRGNEPGAMVDRVEDHLRRQGYTVIRDAPDLATRRAHPRLARVSRGPGYRAARTEIDLPAVQPVIAATRKVAGDQLLLVPTLGGSLPLYLFTENLGKPVVVMPIANHDDNQHAPDENLRLANLWYGIELMASLFTMP